MKIKDIGTVYFVGIGGIGMSALARFFLGRGIRVHGYDRISTPLTDQLTREGAVIHFEEDLSRIPDQTDLAVYTPAVPEDQAELAFLRRQDIPLKKRAEVLGMISRELPTLAVAGTHGKTTTSSMLAWILHRSGVPVNAFLGGIANNFRSNYVGGPAEWMVVEADEFDRSFLHLSPEHAAILSMDADHLDIYGNPESLRTSGFFAFAQKVKNQLLVQKDWRDRLPAAHTIQTFGLEGGTYRAGDIRVEEGNMVFEVKAPDWALKGVHLPLPGKHNVENALAALALASQTGAEPEKLKEALASFAGVQRRFDIRYRRDPVVYIDDYAHHPTELKAAIQAAREFFPGRSVTGIFQPHLYSRTRDFADGFAEALDGLDHSFLLEIYPAREKPIPGVASQMIIERMQHKPLATLGLDQVVDRIRNEKLEVLLTLGAGNIDTLATPIQLQLEKTHGPNQQNN